MSRVEPRAPLEIGGVSIVPGRRHEVELKVTRLPTGTWVSIPVSVVRGRRPGPRVWISAAVHGDELNGVEIVRRVMPLIPMRELCGTVIAVPIVNVLGFLHQDRYLPDRRDLNRCFPGSARGSLAAQMAHLFLTQIVAGCRFGIDLHTGSNHRTNHPQIRADLDDPRVLELAQAFCAPLTIHSNTRDGSLRQVAAERGCTTLLYEAGETLRFDEQSIRVGVDGVLRVLQVLGMIDQAPSRENETTTQIRESRWVRASRGGILLLAVRSGDVVAVGDTLARITDTFSRKESVLRSPADGVVIGLTINPLVNRGDAVVHVGVTGSSEQPPA